MESPNKSQSIVCRRRRPTSLLRAFRRNEDGTALTELAIILPVFILIWIGMINLYNLERGGMRAKITASSKTWDKAMDVAYGGHLPSFEARIPTYAALDSMSNINNHRSGTADAFALLKNGQLSYDGSSGEAKGAATTARMIGQSPGTAPGGGLKNSYSRNMLDDSRPALISSAPGPLVAYFLVIPESAASLGFNHVAATGNRYGSVFAEHTEQVVVLGQTHHLSATYDVLNSPVPKPEFLDDLTYVSGFSRLLAEKDSCLKNVLEISTSLGYLSNCR